MDENKKVQYSYLGGLVSGIVWIVPDQEEFDRYGHGKIIEGKKAVFKDTLFETSDPEIISYLDNHKDYGITWKRLYSSKENAPKKQ